MLVLETVRFCITIAYPFSCGATNRDAPSTLMKRWRAAQYRRALGGGRRQDGG